MVTVLFILSILLFTNFISYAVGKKGGLPDSISAMVFDFRHPWGWSVWLWAVTISLAPALLEAMPKDYQVLAFFTLAFLVFTGVVPLIDKEHRRWHYVFGFLAGICSQACVWKIYPWLLLLWIVMLIYVIAGIAHINDKTEEGPYDGNGVIIAELIATAAVFGSIIIRNYVIS